MLRNGDGVVYKGILIGIFKKSVIRNSQEIGKRKDNLENLERKVEVRGCAVCWKAEEMQGQGRLIRATQATDSTLSLIFHTQ